MLRRTAVLLVLLLFALGLAAYSSAVPLLVELKIKDPVGSLDNPSAVVDDGLLLHGKSAGKGKGSGGTEASGDLKSLTLWLSTDGKEWRKISSDLLSYSSDKITAQINGKGKDNATELFGSPGGDITGETGQTYYVGISASSTSYTGTTLSARLVSWQYVARTTQPVGIPEPAIWPLLAAGALGLGLVLGGRKRA